ncbi:hypothetical protein BpHYR1_036138 [Brachionus plicatilis]|uniref:Uncharacterized protein n=1 Tax=Brachionus plicatilis TaxID=10195 RepID=A0A3M7S5D6_BRAPC|nr:hypothetical protein BpHYR1_036138 [Brachionus plicatilis]
MEINQYFSELLFLINNVDKLKVQAYGNQMVEKKLFVVNMLDLNTSINIRKKIELFQIKILQQLSFQNPVYTRTDKFILNLSNFCFKKNINCAVLSIDLSFVQLKILMPYTSMPFRSFVQNKFLITERFVPNSNGLLTSIVTELY